MADDVIVKRRRRRKPPSEIVIDGEVAHVALTLGKWATIDRDDVDLISAIKWHAHAEGVNNFYALGYVSGTLVRMHRILLNAPKHLNVDHKDGDALNNRRSNIRLATQKQNCYNRRGNYKSVLGVKGVTARRGKYRAQIMINKRNHYLGTFITIEEAAAAYAKAAREAWGEFAKS